MDTLLISVTALSLVMAGAMALVLLHLMREERRRSDARVAALAEMASADVRPAPDPAVSAGRSRLQPARLQPAVSLRDPEQTRAVRSLHRQPDEAPAPDLPLRRELSAADFRLTPDATRPIAGDLFAEPAHSSPWGGRLAIIATLVVLVGASGWLVFRSDARVSQAAATDVPVTTAPAPLELLSLRHTQEPDRLTITGLVQNPRGAAPLARVVATAFTFGPDGTFLASARAPIDFTSLGSGDESPFVVTVPVTGEVARYRVGFRGEDGTVIAHVDRRSDAVAQK
jgi:hypothetical protein